MNDLCQIAQRKRPPEVVKSAVRVLEILELFDRSKQAMMVGEIAAALQYPQSSTSALLRSLAKIGYLTYDIHKRTFIPTERVAFLGGWQSGSFFVDGPVVELTRRLSENTGLTASLFRRNHIQTQWLHTVEANGEACPSSMHDTADLLRSSSGYVLLAALSERDILGLVRRINSEVDRLSMVLRPADVLQRIDEVRRDGYAYLEAFGSATISVAVPSKLTSESVAIELSSETGGITERLSSIISIVRDTIATARFPRGDTGNVDCVPMHRIPPAPAGIRLAASI